MQTALTDDQVKVAHEDSMLHSIPPPSPGPKTHAGLSALPASSCMTWLYTLPTLCVRTRAHLA